MSQRSLVERASATAPPIESVVQQHVDELLTLYDIRARHVVAPHIRLFELSRLDSRLAAHLDGIAAAGTVGRRLCAAQAHPGALFASTVMAIEDGDANAFNRVLLALAAAPSGLTAITDAVHWITPDRLAFVATRVCVGSDPHLTEVALLCAALRGGEHGAVIARALSHPDERVRTRAEYYAMVCGLIDIRIDASEMKSSPLSVIPLNSRCLALQSWDLEEVRTTLSQVRGDSGSPSRELVLASGISGDPRYVDWLIRQMACKQLARSAGQAMALITGLDLRGSGYEVLPPEPDEGAVPDEFDGSVPVIDPDLGLPWPDRQQVEQWWAAQQGRFVVGQRYFMGAPVTREHCVSVLRTGYQPQRILAAQYRCLLKPGTPLFNTRATAWRQQRLLAQMT